VFKISLYYDVELPKILGIAIFAQIIYFFKS
jgi:hypothetical protein